MKHVAMLGLGAMGSPMAKRLAAKFPLVVWNRTRARAEALATHGTRVAESPAACARDADVIVTMLSNALALESVLGSDQGILSKLKPGAVVVDMSTIGRAAAREAALSVETAGGRFVDAPVSGSVGPAERGELVALVGGSDRDVAAAEPVLSAMCSKIVHAGGIGQGQALKVVLNGLGVHHLVAFTSMLALGERAGLAREALVEAFTSGAFTPPSYRGKRDKVLARDFSPEFTLTLTLKDAALNVMLQDEVGLSLPVHREIAREIAQAVGEGLGDKDLFALEQYFAALRR
jgi:3-hydroxyisobutyrate dehydrogenase-like beta-hydroxyacid dehydrogenase